MTSLELRILKYVHEQCKAGRPPKLEHISSRFAPDSTRHVVNSLWSRGLLSKQSYARKGAHRPFVITEQGKALVGGSNVG